MVLIGLLIKEGDTDTNGIIAGALMGVKYGFDDMKKDVTTKNNIKILLDCDPNKKDIKKELKYTTRDLLNLCSEFYNVIINK